MNKLLLNGLLVVLTVATQNCSQPRPIKASIVDPIKRVHIETLVRNIKKYHGQTIQTRGLFECGFEMSAIFPAKPIYDNGKFTYAVKVLVDVHSWPGIWVNFDSRYISGQVIEHYSFRHSQRLITIQGTIDTTQTGHMGMYLAGITNGRIVED
jgi:hypothetical protein